MKTIAAVKQEALPPPPVVINRNTIVVRYDRAELRARREPVKTMSIVAAIAENIPEHFRQHEEQEAIKAITNRGKYQVNSDTFIASTGEPDMVLQARRIVAEWTGGRVWLTEFKDGEMKKRRRPMDATTASMVCQVWDKAEDTTRATIRRIIDEKGSVVALSAMWKAVSKK
jgi:hypothetical protein